MNDQTAVDENYENQVSSSSSIPTNQRASQSQLLTKIYYPDTLYPDNYSFFADRGDTASSQVKSPLPMDTNIQYPTTITDPTGAPSILATVPRQPITEIEIIDRQSKYAVSNIYIYLIFDLILLLYSRTFFFTTLFFLIVMCIF
jgi:hypothetical protein